MSDIISTYSKVLDLSNDMLAALDQGEWEQFQTKMEERETLVQSLRNHSENSSEQAPAVSPEVINALVLVNSYLVERVEQHRDKTGLALAKLNKSIKANDLYQQTRDV